MPELPEVEAVCRKLRAVQGRIIVEVRALRCATPSVKRKARGRRIERVERRGKHILVRLDSGLTLHVHLRMTGNLYPIPDRRFAPAGARVVLVLDDDGAVVFEDSRALGRMDLVDSTRLDAKLDREVGVEPLSAGFTAELFAALARRSRKPSKLFLMDQEKVAGLGNIYAAESLYRAGIHPRKRMQTLSRARIDRLHAAIVAILGDAVQSAWTAYSGPGAIAEAESFPLEVYGREGEPCRACGKAIRRIPQGGRSTYFCPGCQR
jgi:formamidopyrimidine-DNA glycosylase